MNDEVAAGAATPPKTTFTTKQMGDACEMLVAAEVTLAGIPALKVPDLWPSYDVIAQLPGGATERISVKSRHFKRGASFVSYNVNDQFDWLAIVLLPGDGEHRRRFFLIPRVLADAKARRNAATTASADGRYWSISEVPKVFAAYKNNFELRPDGTKREAEPVKTPPPAPIAPPPAPGDHPPSAPPVARPSAGPSAPSRRGR